MSDAQRNLDSRRRLAVEATLLRTQAIPLNSHPIPLVHILKKPEELGFGSVGVIYYIREESWKTAGNTFARLVQQAGPKALAVVTCILPEDSCQSGNRHELLRSFRQHTHRHKLFKCLGLEVSSFQMSTCIKDAGIAMHHYRAYIFILQGLQRS